MGNYLKQRKTVIEFDGDRVEVVYHNLQRKHIGLFSQFSSRDGSGNIVAGFASQMDMFQTLAPAIEECVTSIRGITQADGTPIEDVGLIMSDVYFIPLVSDIVSAVMESSFLNTEEIETVKKSPTVQKRVLATAVGVKDSAGGM